MELCTRPMSTKRLKGNAKKQETRLLESAKEKKNRTNETKDFFLINL